MKYNVNSSGFYGDFGGAYIPEMLFSNIDELNKNYLSIVEKDSFKKEFNYYLKKYVGSHEGELKFENTLVGLHHYIMLIDYQRNMDLKFI